METKVDDVENKMTGREDATHSESEENGEEHGKLLASLIISKVFKGEVYQKSGRKGNDEFVESVVNHLIDHFTPKKI